MRHMRPVCAACVYWTVDPSTSTSTAGHCHRFPPLVFANAATGTIVQKYPTTDHHQWCGEWSGDEKPLIEAARWSVLHNARQG